MIAEKFVCLYEKQRFICQEDSLIPAIEHEECLTMLQFNVVVRFDSEEITNVNVMARKVVFTLVNNPYPRLRRFHAILDKLGYEILLSTLTLT